jgi:hypothetical protein
MILKQYPKPFVGFFPLPLQPESRAQCRTALVLHWDLVWGARCLHYGIDRSQNVFQASLMSLFQIAFLVRIFFLVSASHFLKGIVLVFLFCCYVSMMVLVRL